MPLVSRDGVLVDRSQVGDVTLGRLRARRHRFEVLHCAELRSARLALAFVHLRHERQLLSVVRVHGRKTVVALSQQHNLFA